MNHNSKVSNNKSGDDSARHSAGSPVDQTGLRRFNQSRQTIVDDSIAALCSPPGVGAIAVIRISGKDAFKLIEPLLPQMKFDESQERKMQLCSFYSFPEKQLIDEPLCCWFRGPRSFTGENAVEIYCHGGSYIVKRILESLYSNGFRPAEAGEFTQRAFLNGKLDLTSAEGIRDLIEAQSDQQWQAARYLAEGKLASLIESLRDRLIHAMAYLEAQIDFPDEGDTQSLNLTVVDDIVKEVQEVLAKLFQSYNNGRIARNGLKVAIIGEPNMGKSTLLNALLGQERAIVTDVAGTTRDYIEESCMLRGRLVRLIDTAGLRETSDSVEKIGVEKALELAQDADLIVLLLAADRLDQASSRQQIEEWAEKLGSERCIKVLSKADLRKSESNFSGFIPISCHREDGLDILTDSIAARVDQGMEHLKSDHFITSPRQHAAVGLALEYLNKFRDLRQSGGYEEMLAFELQEVVRSLISVIGQVDNEDILDRVFGEFCLGK